MKTKLHINHERVFFVLFNCFCLFVLLLSVRGLKGNPNINNINSPKWKASGPFELSPERGRFALTYSVAEDKSVFLNPQLAEFATPDLGFQNNRFVSLFDPGISFLTIPGYLIGKLFGYSQMGTTLTIVFFSFLNVILIQKISVKFRINRYAAAIGALVYIFATPAFAYSVSLYQHQVSTFLILICIYILIRFNNLRSSILVGLLFGIGFLIDYPNAFLMLPILLFVLQRYFNFSVNNGIKFRINPAIFLPILAIILPLILLGEFNIRSYGNYFQLSGNTQRLVVLNNSIGDKSSAYSLEKFTQNIHHENALLTNYFQTRNLLNGLYILLFSPDRGIINYAPVLFFGMGGAYYFYKQKNVFLELLTAIVLMNFILYSLWGDPWGGWSFGSRYLVPFYAVSGIFIAKFINESKRRIWLILPFLLIFSFSNFINSAGALTSSANPPQIEVLNLEKLSGTIQKYTYEKNFDLLNQNLSKSFVFQSWGHQFLSAWQYLFLVFGIVNLVGVYLCFSLFWENNNKL